MFSTAGNPLKTSKKSGRSTSPRAVERRRLQNRLSQRKHREKRGQSIKDVDKTQQDTDGGSTSDNTNHEKHQDTEEENIEVQERPRTSGNSRSHGSGSEDACSGDLVGYMDSQTIDFQDSLLASWLPGVADNHGQGSFMTDDLVSPHIPAWPHVDPLMMPAGNIKLNINLNESRMSQQNQHPQLTSPSQRCSCNGTTGPCASHLESIRNQVFAATSIPHQHPQPTRYNSFRPMTSPPTPKYPSPAPLGAGLPDSSSTDAAATDITRRFGVILEAMLTVGFQDFDEVAAAYYTAEFEKGSFLAMTQCASRSRRLKTMLRELQRSSSQWPRRESRGLEEAILEAASSLCVEEMDKLKKARVTLPATVRSEPAHLITAFERLLSDHRCSTEREYRSCLGGDTSDPSVLEELKLWWGQMEAAPDAASTCYQYLATVP